LRKMKMNTEGASKVFFEQIQNVEGITEHVKNKIEVLLEDCETIMVNEDKDNP